MIYSVKDVISDNPIPIKRIEWEDGTWWDVLAEMPYGVQSRIRAAAAGSVVFVNGELSTENMDRQRMVQAVEEANLIRLTGCSVGWSFKGTPTREAIEAMPSVRVAEVLKEMNRLHALDLMGTPRDEKKTSPSQSSTVDHSGNDGQTPVTTSRSLN